MTQPNPDSPATGPPQLPQGRRCSYRSAIGACGDGRRYAAHASQPSLEPVTPAAMPTRNLGKTGYKIGIFSLGGQAALEKPTTKPLLCPSSTRTRPGVNYIDTSSIYGGPLAGASNMLQGNGAPSQPSLPRHQNQGAYRDDSLRMIEKSLQLLQTDHVDLWQLHDVGTMHDIDQIFAKGGAMEALIEMKEQKVVRHLGFTGHYRPTR